MLPVVVPVASFERHDPAESVELASHQCLTGCPCDRCPLDCLAGLTVKLMRDIGTGWDCNNACISV